MSSSDRRLSEELDRLLARPQVAEIIDYKVDPDGYEAKVSYRLIDGRIVHFDTLPLSDEARAVYALRETEGNVELIADPEVRKHAERQLKVIEAHNRQIDRDVEALQRRCMPRQPTSATTARHPVRRLLSTRATRRVARRRRATARAPASPGRRSDDPDDLVGVLPALSRLLARARLSLARFANRRKK